MKKNISKIPMSFFKHSNIVLDFGVTVISNVVVGGIIGYYLDKWTFNNKVLLVIFLFLGIVAGMYNGMRVLLKEAKKDEEKHDEK
jgi:ATP synthase protein I